MWTLLDPRLWGAALFAGALAFGAGYLKGHHDESKSRDLVEAAARTEATQEARKVEAKRQSSADLAARMAAERFRVARVDADSARGAARGLRDDLDAVVRLSSQSSEAAARTTTTLRDVFESCAERYIDLAEKADGHVGDAQRLYEGWPGP